ncbi:acetate--CoA ligase family protein [Nannocystis pusilla]|uniref:Acetate--CoA ligase family protein n=1 Tax=Nannocystis pusilla TaxID=889268 RepID=A0ABS7U5B8_9BACT|nr:acetate--CoA ligase [Nannocystis pusilla]MBZ5715718.1 acetate--CoA ligase family protein [Nannocystis pusilla]
MSGVTRKITPTRVPEPARVDPVLVEGEHLEPYELDPEGLGLGHVLAPCSVALIGASRDERAIGHRLLLNLLAAGFQGPIFPVNPHAESVAGVPAFASIRDIPDSVELAVIAVPAAAVPAVVDECAERGVRGLVVVSAGFREIGREGAARERRLLQRVREGGMRLVGPNCLGIMNTAIGLDATFAPVRPPPGKITVLSQSGALGVALLDGMARLGLGLSSFVSIGNRADVSSNDLLRYWEDDDATEIVLLYLESFGNPRKFSQIARRLVRSKPIVAVTAGRSAAGRRAASSHTAAAATSDDAVEALLAQTGVIRVDTPEQLLDVTRVLTSQPLPAGDRVAIVGNSGGPGVLAVDACVDAGLRVTQLGESTQYELRRLLGPHAAVENPVDMIASATAAHYEQTLSRVLADDAVDMALVIHTPIVEPADDVVAAIERAVVGARKPVVVAALLPAVTPGVASPRALPCFTSPEPAALALGRVARHAAWLRRDPGVVPELADIDSEAARALVEDALQHHDDVWLDLDRAVALVRAYGVPAIATRRAASADAAALLAEDLGFPVVLKAASGAILHKTEVAALRLDLRDADAVCRAFAELAPAGPVVVQPMAGPGVELIVGLVRRRAFGPLLMFGAGGVATELLADRAFHILPLTDVDARELVRGLRSSPRLFGYRGAPPADVAELEALLLRVGQLACEIPELEELDLNPVIASPRGAVAVDVKVHLRRP